MPAQTEKLLDEALQKMKAPIAPYQLKILPETTAATVKSTIGQAGKDGLAMFPWMAENGYVQIAPTRMEYLSQVGPPASIPTLIIVPVEKRRSGLKLPK